MMKTLKDFLNNLTRSSIKNNKEIGHEYELIALNYLKKRGLRFLKKNFNSKFGEIDLIFLKQETIHFIEVKARKDDKICKIEENVTEKKQKRIKRAVRYFLLKNPELMDYYIQFDVVTINISSNEIKYFENCFY